jgi:hypothetical protein
MNKLQFIKELFKTIIIGTVAAVLLISVVPTLIAVFESYF